MGFRIYVDESGTHADDWLVIGMLFVPDHGPLHVDLCKAKDAEKYFNKKPRRKARYKETHLTEFRSSRDVDVATDWIDLFLKHPCYFRAIVVDWTIWNGKYFGGPFDPATLKKRRAYKKWAEMLLQPELSAPLGGTQIRNAELYLDRLRISYGYDVIDHLEQRFLGNYEGRAPYISKFQHTDSWRDANQCLQLADVLTRSVYQSLCPADSEFKRATWQYLEKALKPYGVERFEKGFWKQFAPNSLRKHVPKFSAWFWQPTREQAKRVRQQGQRGGSRRRRK